MGGSGREWEWGDVGWLVGWLVVVVMAGKKRERKKISGVGCRSHLNRDMDDLTRVRGAGGGAPGKVTVAGPLQKRFGKTILHINHFPNPIAAGSLFTFTILIIIKFFYFFKKKKRKKFIKLFFCLFFLPRF